ncbi:hypothetical protein LMG28688_07256 [Paraburkholderia caffeinitolerans]|uniref:Uncharacterized protein n=1 Tax=Paraburkholderia caffeinitolerans TaxID=1723730 RepID=A0A6J5H0R9_9BURK|nr:hypothetical protein [Paraburkholderia caffeinitolerans]CAB3810476.1 hypothetical protein LMG28688_07256 [Paraburkholderia caffeinitolerans]
MKKIEIADFVIRLLTLIAVVSGGVWAWYQYRESGATDWQNNLALKTDVLPYHDNLRLLVVHVESKNPRPNKFELRSDHHDSFELRVRRLVPKAAEGQVFKEDEGDLIARSDLLALADGDYEFLPAAEMDDMQVVVIKEDTWVSIFADMKINNNPPDAKGKPDYDENAVSAVVYIPKSEGQTGHRKAAQRDRPRG